MNKREAFKDVLVVVGKPTPAMPSTSEACTTGQKESKLDVIWSCTKQVPLLGANEILRLSFRFRRKFKFRDISSSKWLTFQRNLLSSRFFKKFPWLHYLFLCVIIPWLMVLKWVLCYINHWNRTLKVLNSVVLDDLPGAAYSCGRQPWWTFGSSLIVIYILLNNHTFTYNGSRP